MAQWKYKVDKVPFPYSADSLDTFYGRHGWELCGICTEYNEKARMQTYVYTFKQPYKDAYGKMLDELADETTK